MLSFVKARKWVDFVDKNPTNLSQQTKNWDRFIDPPYSRAQHNFTCAWHSRARTVEHTAQSIEHRAQHVAFLSPNYLCVGYACSGEVFTNTHENYVLNYINMLLYEWNVAYMWCQFYRTSKQFLFFGLRIHRHRRHNIHESEPKPQSKEYSRLMFVTEFRTYIFLGMALSLSLFIHKCVCVLRAYISI